MTNLIKNEFTKIGIIKLISPFIIFTLVPCFQKYIFKSIANNSYYYNIPFVSIILIILFSSTISSEIENGTLRLYLTKPISRQKVLISKILTSFVYSLILSTYILTIYMILLKQFSFNYIINYYIYTLPIYSLLSISIFNSIFIKNTPINTGICIILSTFSGLLSETLFKNKITFIQYTFLPYLDFSIFLDKNSINYINTLYKIDLSIYNAIFTNILFIMFFITLSMIIFVNKDIKA